MGEVTVLFDGKGGGGGEDEKTEYPCPVRAVGHNDGIYYYVTPSGALRQLKARDHTHNNLFSLFEDEASWLRLMHGKKPRKDSPPTWDHQVVAEFLMESAAAVGLVDLEKSLRGVGVWHCRDGGLVVHTGDRILVKDEWQPAGQKIDGKIFVAMPAVDRPADSEASPADMRRLFNFIGDSWSWSNPDGDARLILGWIGCAILTGALRWRPHIWLTADRGAGKSKLDEMIESILGNVAEKVSDPTGAAVRGILGVSARGVLADEVEPGDNRRAASMIELARMASTDSQGAVVRGTSDGRTQSFPIRACFLFSSILVPHFRPQDFGRITIVEMRALRNKSLAEIRDFEALFKEISNDGARIRRRVINSFSRFRGNSDVYAAAMAGDGHGRRAADQIATLLAMADAMLEDAKVDEIQAEGVLKDINIMDLTGGDEIGDDKECLQHLLSTRTLVRFPTGTQQYTIGELIAACPENQKNWRQNELKRMGLAVLFEGGTGYLVIANSHRELSRIFKETRWSAGGHSRVLKRLKFAQTEVSKVVSFAGSKSRAAWLLLEDLPLDRQVEEFEEEGDGADGGMPIA